uniref:cytokinin riboside 5'-monophosphate phosphoribohydrolase n=1 Tax=Salix viminalis TaxID=40686 RepID=A0A6N2M6B7_SALVM
MGKLTRVCVFCGSKSGNKKIFSDAALDLGRQLGNSQVERKMDLVYGGGSVGLMGLVSQTVYDGGSHSYTDSSCTDRDFRSDCRVVLIVSDMHERKAEMARRADAFIALPEEGFINPSARNIVISAKTAGELIQRMEDYIPVHEHVTSSQSWNAEECNADF